MLRRVAVIKVAQEVGISLAEIGAALESLPEGRTPTREDWNVLSTGWRDELDRRIAQLKKLRDGLTDCIGCGCMSIDKCPLRQGQTGSDGRVSDRSGDRGREPARIPDRKPSPSGNCSNPPPAAA